MKEDKLEQFIQATREQFDSATPSFNNWKAIEQQLNQQTAKRRQLPVWKTIRLVAAGIALLVVGGLIGNMLTLSQSTESAPITLEDIAPDLLETEAYYEAQVSQKLKVLATYQQDTMVLKDLAELDIFLEELKAALLEVPKNTQEEVIDNIIKSYQAKLEILERVLIYIQSNSNNIQISEQDAKSI